MNVTVEDLNRITANGKIVAIDTILTGAEDRSQ